MLTPTDSHCSPIHITESPNSSTSLVRGLMGLMGIIISQQYCVFFFLVELDNAPTFCYKNLSESTENIPKPDDLLKILEYEQVIQVPDILFKLVETLSVETSYL